ncbi:hypothetical protein O9G_003090 [Rozella allomycis CSF55]|uniref:Uncharacterized protein n=1 Tax=Rozella allomycis (strain CSF55) TaxID=988480 RepID=A0A075AX62_ROZAC|nr:hypothetical protein O9G_003090 [Rozella allomycis CSF55]|eukprot:EPZ33094.1 hypothetical protein O9G_003090 [Rozella allomycis CSF55]
MNDYTHYNALAIFAKHFWSNLKGLFFVRVFKRTWYSLWKSKAIKSINAKSSVYQDTDFASESLSPFIYQVNEELSSPKDQKAIDLSFITRTIHMASHTGAENITTIVERRLQPNIPHSFMKPRMLTKTKLAKVDEKNKPCV